MKGYFIESGYMGYVGGEYMLFADEEDYKEYFYDCNQLAGATFSLKNSLLNDNINSRYLG